MQCCSSVHSCEMLLPHSAAVAPAQTVPSNQSTTSIVPRLTLLLVQAFVGCYLWFVIPPHALNAVLPVVICKSLLISRARVSRKAFCTLQHWAGHCTVHSAIQPPKSERSCCAQVNTPVQGCSEHTCRASKESRNASLCCVLCSSVQYCRANCTQSFSSRRDRNLQRTQPLVTNYLAILVV